MTDKAAFMIAIVCLYSTGHPIGATTLLVIYLYNLLRGRI